MLGLGVYSEDQDFVCNDGVCRPLDSETLKVYRDLQAYINLGLEKKGLANRVEVDGDLGPNTLTGMYILWNNGVKVMPPREGVIGLARNAEGYIANYAAIFGPIAGQSVWDMMMSVVKPETWKRAVSANKKAPLSDRFPLFLGAGILGFALWKRSKRRK